jgi:predicted transposase YbfD/YdcC
MSVKERFGIIDDPRHQSYVEHNLADILIIVMCGVLCGLDGLNELIIYAKSKISFFREHFCIMKIPSKSTFSRILSMIDGEKVAKVIIDLMRESIEDIGDIIAVDGKAIRSTSAKDKSHSALQILTAYLTESGIILGQQAIHEKTNEIPIFQEMLEYLNVEKKIITADAMHCQKETCKKIINKKGDYVFGLKGNQRNFYKDAELFFNDKQNRENIEVFEAPVEKSHGRTERRICSKIKDISWLSNLKEWSGLGTIFSIRRISSDKHKTTDETNYYITSLSETPEKLLKITREHWKIESLHWMLDVVFSEDDCRLQSDDGQKSLNAFRKLAIFLHRNYLKSSGCKQSAKSNMLKCLINEKLLLRIIKNL